MAFYELVGVWQTIRNKLLELCALRSFLAKLVKFATTLKGYARISLKPPQNLDFATSDQTAKFYFFCGNLKNK